MFLEVLFLQLQLLLSIWEMKGVSVVNNLFTTEYNLKLTSD